MMAADLPVALIKFIYNNNAVIRSSCIIGMAAITLLFMHIFFKAISGRRYFSALATSL